MAAMQTTGNSDDMGRRIDNLARPKQFAPGFERDRRSVYWVDREPPKPDSRGVTVITVRSEGHQGMHHAVATPRVQQLSQHKNPVSQWKGDNKSAQQATASERLVYLGKHKEVNPNHRMERTPYMYTTPAARSATATNRLEQLAAHKDRSDPFEVYQKEWGQYFHVPVPALSAKPSERLEQLAESKRYHKDFHGEKPVQWPVSEQALKSLATIRLQQLSRPRSRTMIRDDFDPYKVSPAARKTRPTPRLEELAVPIPRKVRTKRV